MLLRPRFHLVPEWTKLTLENEGTGMLPINRRITSVHVLSTVEPSHEHKPRSSEVDKVTKKPFASDPRTAIALLNQADAEAPAAQGDSKCRRTATSIRLVILDANIFSS